MSLNFYLRAAFGYNYRAMKKLPFSHDQDKKELTKERSHRRRSQMLQRQVIESAIKKPSQTHTTHLLRLRHSTIKKTLTSLSEQAPSTFKFERTGPLSDEPNFGRMRHDANKKPRVVRERNNEIYHVGKQTPVKMIQSGEFQSPNETVYGFGHTVISIQTPGGTRDNIHPLAPHRSQRKINFDMNEQSRVSEVQLSFENLIRPAGKNEPMNNKKSQGGFSADELFTQQFDAFKKELVDAGLATETEINEYMNNAPHFEHTHLIASHFGRIKNKEGQMVDPRNRESTFVAPAPLNTEMMLFEKFADFLVYMNHKHNGHAVKEQTVDYTCTVLFAENTTTAIGLQLQITDRHTGIKFSQTWDSPYAVTEKPSMALYTTLIQALKDGLNRQLDGQNPPPQRPKI